VKRIVSIPEAPGFPAGPWNPPRRDPPAACYTICTPLLTAHGETRLPRGV